MRKFEYAARDRSEKVYKGTIVAEDEASVRTKLQQMGFYPTSVKKKHKEYGLIARAKIKADDIMFFTEQLSAMINAGLPLIRSLQTIAKQAENKALKSVIYNLRVELEGGSTFSDALAKHPKTFSNLYVNLVKAGETGGILDEVLIRICEYINKKYILRQNLKKVFSYSAIVLSVAIIVVAFLVTFIVPVFAKAFQTMDLSLPLPTLILVGISKFVINFWWLILFGLFLLGFLYLALKKSDRGSLAIDNFKLKMPLFGGLISKMAVSHFIRSLGLLLSSGVTITEALAVVREISGNKVIANIIDRLKSAVREGKRITESLSQEVLFPPIVTEMVAAGEETGALDKMLKKSADFLERDIDNSLQRLVMRLEPLLTFFLAIIVGFIALAIYLPMFDLISSMTK